MKQQGDCRKQLTSNETLRSPCRNWKVGSQGRMFLKQVVLFRAHQTAHLLRQGEGTMMLSLHTEREHSITLNISMSASHNHTMGIMHVNTLAVACWKQEYGLSASPTIRPTFICPANGKELCLFSSQLLCILRCHESLIGLLAFYHRSKKHGCSLQLFCLIIKQTNYFSSN